MLDPDGEGPGILTERDVLKAVAGGEDLERELAADHLTPDAVCGEPDWDLEKAASTMVAGGFRHLVVCEGSEVVGVLSVRDIVRAWAGARARGRVLASRMAARLDGDELVFPHPDPDGALGGVRLQQDVRLPGELLGFTRTDDGWELRVPRPDVDRVEYSYELQRDGGSDWSANGRTPRASAAPSATSRCSSCPATSRRPGCPPSRHAGRAASCRCPPAPWTPTSPACCGRPTAWPTTSRRRCWSCTTAPSTTRSPRSPCSSTRWSRPGGSRDARRAAGSGRPDRDLQRLAGVRPGARARARPALVKEAPATAVLGMGASLGGLAMLQAQRSHPGTFAGLYLQSSSFFHRVLDEQESGFDRFQRVAAFVDSVLRAASAADPVPVVMTAGSSRRTSTTTG